MKRYIILLSITALLCSCTGNNPYKDVVGLVPDETLYLYPDGQDSNVGLPGALGPLESNGLTSDEIRPRWGIVTNIGDKARIELYLPENCCGKMAVICPPGGYGLLSDYTEGIFAARWLAHHGIASCVLWYRMPNGHPEVPLRDVQNALRYCRSRAAEWGINEIGVLGMSAGGHLAACASTLFTDDVTRPDWAVLMYPVISTADGVGDIGSFENLLGKNPSPENLHRFSADLNVSPNTPRTYIVKSNKDFVPAENIIRYYEALHCNGVKNSEMHILPEGNHGWGFADKRLATKKELFLARGSELIEDQIPGCRENMYHSILGWLGVREDAPADMCTGIRNPDKIVFLYPEGQNSDKGLPEAEGPVASNGMPGPERHLDMGFIENVTDSARLEIFFPKNPNGQLIILVPGGGYAILNAMAGGTLAGNWLSDRGITAVTLKYRMPNGNPLIPLQDLRNAILYCRAHAGEWGVDQVGLLGGSAGGHLVSLATGIFKDPQVKPDFLIALYPLISLEKGLPGDECTDRFLGKDADAGTISSMCAQNVVYPEMPPVYVAANFEDFLLGYRHFTEYARALDRAGVPTEFHIYSVGWHGWSFLSRYYCDYLNKDNTGIWDMSDSAETTYEDQLGICRSDFELTLLSWLESLR